MSAATIRFFAMGQYVGDPPKRKIIVQVGLLGNDDTFSDAGNLGVAADGSYAIVNQTDIGRFVHPGSRAEAIYMAEWISSIGEQRIHYRKPRNRDEERDAIRGIAADLINQKRKH